MGKRRRLSLVELGKDVLIVALACSAVYLAGLAQVTNPLERLWQEPEHTAAAGSSYMEIQAEAVHPVAMAAALEEAGGVARYGVQYDDEAVSALFQPVASLLVEALSGAGAARPVTEAQWRQALATAPGLYFDFGGEIPFSVLPAWLAGDTTSLEGTVRRLVLTVAQGRAMLYWQDAEDGKFYAAEAGVVKTDHLDEAVAGLNGNGAYFAFESELCQGLEPYTLLPAETPAPAVYQAVSPLRAGEQGLQEILEILAFPVGTVTYSAADQQVARSGNDTLRLLERGTVIYQADEGGSGRFPVPFQGERPTAYEAAEACRALAQQVVAPYCGQARLALAGMTETGTGWQVDFRYVLDGLPVFLEEGDVAASFQVMGGEITQFTLHLRGYTALDETSLLLPLRQALAALEAREGGAEGAELMLAYFDRGGDTLSASWAGRRAGEGED